MPGHAALLLEADLGRVDGDLLAAFLVEAEDDPPLQDADRVVEVDDRPLRALQALVRALDQVAAALRQDLDRDVVRDEVLFDQLADEVVVGLRRRRKADFDFLEAHGHQGLEHLHLAARIHRVDEGLIAIAQVDRAPQRRLLDLAVGPLAVRKAERQRAEGYVLAVGHLLRLSLSGEASRVFLRSLCGWGGVVGKTKTSCPGAGGHRRAPRGGSPQVRSRLLSKAFLFIVGGSVAVPAAWP